MTTRNILKNLSWVVMGLLWLVFIALTIIQHQNSNELNGRNFEQNHNQQSTDFENAVQKLPISSNSGDVSPSGSIVTKMMRATITLRNEDYIEAFNIPPDDADAFADILLAEKLAGLELTDKADGIHNPTDADRARFEQLWNDYRAEYESKKIELLGEDVFRKYPDYVNRYAIENLVGNFADLFDSTDQPLTDTQRENLVEALIEAQEIYYKETEDESGNTFIFQSDYYSEANMNRVVELSTLKNEAYLKVVRGILSTSQTEKIKTYLNQKLEKSVSVMKTGALDYGYNDYDEEGHTGAQ